MHAIPSVPPKLVVINDVTGYGRCSTAVALPIISVSQVQACLVPTSVFSNHTGFPTWHFDDYTQQMPAYLHGWEQLHLDFDGIYCGFLGSVEQISIVEDFIHAQKQLHAKRGAHGQPLILVDPIMGDHGKRYHTITEAHCHKMRQLVSHAHIITPNITEACLLTDTPYQDTWTESRLQALTEQLHRMGPDNIVITGIQDNGNYVNFVSQSSSTACKSSENMAPITLPYDFCRLPVAGESRPGTGDIFASIIAAKTLTGVPFAQSVITAASFIRLCTEGSSLAGIPVSEGVCFEQYLNRLL